MGTPYITPAMLTTAPTGIAWSIIPMPRATNQQQFAEQWNICSRATDIVNGYTNQVFRSTIDYEEISVPDFYATIQNYTGQVRWILTRWPVTAILAAQTSPNALPPSWSSVTTGAWRIETPVLGTYNSYLPGGSGGSGGQTIYLACGTADWSFGRNGFLVGCSYQNGWPHSGLMTSVEAGATTLPVDDVTGFAGAAAYIYDGASSESVVVTSAVANAPITLPNSTATAQAGPGTVTLSSPLQYAHTGGNPTNVIISSIPQDVIWATVLAAMVQALDSGIVAITAQNIPGSQTVGGHGIQDLVLNYQQLLDPYKRVI
jgi:hypothetical protein